MKRLLVLCVLVLAWGIAPSFGDVELVLKNGKSVKCADFRLEGNLYHVMTLNGQLVIIPARIVAAVHLSGDGANVESQADGERLADPIQEEEERSGPSGYEVTEPEAVAGGAKPEASTSAGQPRELGSAGRRSSDTAPAGGRVRIQESDRSQEPDDPRTSRWAQPAFDPAWQPESGLGEDVTEFNPSTWSQPHSDPTWEPESGLGEDVTEFNPSKWIQPRSDPTWVPEDGFKKRDSSLTAARVPMSAASTGEPSLGEDVVAIRRGVASWYGEAFHGKTTASGAPYDMNAHTAGHPDLPFGSLVLVTNLDNGRNILLEVTDRGPSVPGREINLSLASARALDMVEQGLAPVQMEILRP
jgi:hypothetical protein